MVHITENLGQDRTETRPVLPFSRLGTIGPSSPIIVSAPHGGTTYSDRFLVGADSDAMRTLEDSGTAEIANRIALDDRPTLIATCPRAIIDLNRPADALDPRLIPSVPPPENPKWHRYINAGYGVIPRLSADRRELYTKLPDISELNDRIEAYHKPYHTALQAMIDDSLKQNPHVMLVDIHSMPQAKQNQKPLPDFVFGDLQGITLPLGLKNHVNQFMQATPYSWGWNHPYAGGYITQKYGTGAAAIPTLQIEVNRGLFLKQTDISQDILLVISDFVRSMLNSLSEAILG